MKKLCFLMIVAIIFSCCAKSLKIKYAEPEARQLCEEDFYKRYHVLVTKEEKQEFEKIKSLSDCREFLKSFWDKRDTDPTTPENEFKDEMETRSRFIEKEGLFTNTDAAGILFSSNGGFFGNLANVYMLHGMPDYIEVMKNGRTFVDLMIWVYFDETGRRHKYRFLFYNKNEVGSFVLYRPNYDFVLGLEEINKSPTFISPAEVYYELEQRMGYIFLLSLVYFSDDNSMNVDKAMDPPKTASEIIKAEAPEIRGQLPEKTEELAHESNFKSTIPAKFSAFFNKDGGMGYGVEIKCEDLDWKKNENGILESNLVLKVTAQNLENPNEILTDVMKIQDFIEDENEINKMILVSYSVFAQDPSGNKYKITAFLQNTLTKKYNSWIEEIER